MALAIRRGNLLGIFIQTELLIALFGGASAAVLFGLFAHVDSFRVLLYALVLLIGTLVGLEIPLLLRILKDQLQFKDLVSKVFTFDYIGALLASLLFPLVLVPTPASSVRVFSSAFSMASSACSRSAFFGIKCHGARWLRLHGFTVLALLTVGFAYSERIVSWSEAAAYGEDIIFAQSTPYQRITLTRRDDDLRLYLNGNLQFSSRDEYRYHESLVHPGLARLPHARRVLVLGGGDGLAVREILRYPQIESVTLVDLDPAMTQLFSTQELLTKLNDNALASPKSAHRQPRRLHVVEREPRGLRFHRRRLPRSLEFQHRQALHHRLLSTRQDRARAGRRARRAMHLALRRAQILLVHR